MENTTSEKHDNRYDGFCNLCKQINESNISYFRGNTYFKSIVENVNSRFGLEYYKLLKNNYSDLLNKIDWKKIELLANIGNPISSKYTFNNNEYMLSHTIMRYLLFTMNIFSHIKNKTDINKLNIIEIGGGFGFQAVLMYELSNLFNIEVEKYTILDLKSVCNLQTNFIKQCNKINNIDYLNFESTNYEDFKLDSNSNFVISNYALGELNSHWQNLYVKNILSKINHGYLCWNFSPKNPKIHSYFNSKPVIKEEEEPQTNTPPIKSYIVRY